MGVKQQKQPGTDRKKQMKSNIALTALALFNKNGFHRTSIRNIAGACGISNSSLYEYFDSKEDMIVYISKEHIFNRINHIIGELEKEIKEHSYNSLDALKRVMETAVSDGASMTYASCFTEVIVLAIRNDIPQITEMYDQIQKTVITFLKRIIFNGMEDGSLSKSVSADDGALFVFGAIVGLRCVNIFNERKLNISKVIDNIFTANTIPHKEGKV